MDTLNIVGISLDTIGTILIAYTALRVHGRVRKERRIDGKVVAEMRSEMLLGVLGGVLVVIGYVFQLADYLL